MRVIAQTAIFELRYAMIVAKITNLGRRNDKNSSMVFSMKKIKGYALFTAIRIIFKTRDCPAMFFMFSNVGSTVFKKRNEKAKAII